MTLFSSCYLIWHQHFLNPCFRPLAMAAGKCPLPTAIKKDVSGKIFSSFTIRL